MTKSFYIIINLMLIAKYYNKPIQQHYSEPAKQVICCATANWDTPSEEERL